MRSSFTLYRCEVPCNLLKVHTGPFIHVLITVVRSSSQRIRTGKETLQVRLSSMTSLVLEELCSHNASTQGKYCTVEGTQHLRRSDFQHIPFFLWIKVR